MSAAHQVLTAARMREAEAALIAGGESVESLMERAGQGAAEWIWRLAAGRPVTVLCGPGNNGGDGYVIARVLAARCLPVSVVAPQEPATPASRAAREAWGGEPLAQTEGHVFVDCLFGTGLSRSLSDDHARLITRLSSTHELSVAVDLPSGVDADTGDLLGAAARYDLTIALGAWKRAHWLMPAAGLMGERRLVDIGLADVRSDVRLVGPISLPVPRRDAHKYTRGMVLVVGGEMPGAAVLAARAAQHGGAGYIKLAAPDRPEALPVDIVFDCASDSGTFVPDGRIDALLLGPGLGRGEMGKALLRSVLDARKPAVLDADALMLLDRTIPLHKLNGTLATPHEGELAALCKAFDISAPCKLDRAQELAKASQMVILAKGADTVLASPDGETRMFPAASPWLSTAGTGDVLAGLAASRLATGERVIDAATQAVVLHGEAARVAGPAFSPSQLIEAIPAAYARLLS